MNLLKRSRQIISLLFIFITYSAYGQSGMPDEFKNSPVKDQLEYIESKTRIYENFRAVREDMFQSIKSNIDDTLTLMDNQIERLNSENRSLRNRIDSLNKSLEGTRTNLDDVTRSKNSMMLLGMEVEKGTYNTIMWTIIFILLALLIIGFLIFKRNQNVVVSRNKDLDDLRAEFEAYRKTSRESREKMALQHFNELKKLRGE